MSKNNPLMRFNIKKEKEKIAIMKTIMNQRNLQLIGFEYAYGTKWCYKQDNGSYKEICKIYLNGLIKWDSVPHDASKEDILVIEKDAKKYSDKLALMKVTLANLLSAIQSIPINTVDWLIINHSII